MTRQPKQSPRRRGPRPTLDEPTKFSTNLDRARFDALAAYAAGHKISIAEATRRAIDLLTGAAENNS